MKHSGKRPMEDDEDGAMVDRLCAKYAEGGEVKAPDAHEDDFEIENEDLEDPELEMTDDEDTHDSQETVREHGTIARIMASMRKQDKLPRTR